MTTTRPPARVLVSAASKHGATAEIAEHIATGLETAGFDVMLDRPEHVADLTRFDVVVLGSAVYAGHWLKDAKELAERIGDLAHPPAVWLFSSGPIGDPPKPDDDPVDVAGIVARTGASDHRLFAGKLDKATLGFGERAIVAALRSPTGDFRDWVDIAGWTAEIAKAMTADPAESPAMADGARDR